jgi:hypothetical protein
MRRDTCLFRLAAITALAGLSAPLAPPVRAQTAPGEVNPPARVGALTRVRGTVSLHAAGAETWSPAAVNYPVTSGEGVWTEPGAGARIDLSATDLVMDGATEIEVNALDERAFVATLPEGEAYLRIRDIAVGESYTLITPRGAATISTPGRYAVLAGDTETPTRIAVLEGAAILGDGSAGSLSAGQAAEITGTEAPFQVRLVPVSRDLFIDRVLDGERPRPARARLPPLVAAMPGGAELAEYGTWSQSPQYGEVWYPEVRPGWVPYREGHWAYVAPWGWTWIDADPWGFAPFHYGRWVDIGGRWAWTPGRPEPMAEAPPYPVYAPALVTFFGVGAAVGAAALLGGGSVGWVPLGPGEPYRPWFHAGPRYERDVNIRNVANVTQITTITNTTNVTVNQFHNAAGATVVPAAAMAASRPVAGEARPATPQVLAAAQPVVGRPPVPPTTATAGVTPAVARAVQAVPPPAGVAPRPAAPGPVIHAQAPAGTPGAAGQHAAPPPLRHGGPPSAQAARPQAAVPAQATSAAAPHPVAPPALRPPGAKPPAPTAQAGAAPAAHGPALPAPFQAPAHIAPAVAHAASPPAPATPAPHPAPVPGPHAPAPVPPVATAIPPVAHPQATPVVHPAPVAPQAPTVAHPVAAPAVAHPPAPPIVHQAPPPPVAHPQAPAVPVPHPPAPVFHPAPPAPVPAPHPVPASVHAEPPHAAAPPPAPHPSPPAPMPHAAPTPQPAPHQGKHPGQP